jgi:hypothetical protein
MGLTVLIQSAQCAGNTHDEDRPCDGFFWRDDLEAPNKSGKQLCGGPGCQARAKARVLHQKCVRRFCIDCCKDSAKDPVALKCIAPKHKVAASLVRTLCVYLSYADM